MQADIILPRLVIIAGVDGAGKSSLSEWLVARLQDDGIDAALAWSRFRNYLSKPLLALTRLTGHNYYSEIDGHPFGYHNFEKLAGFRQLFAALQAVDVNIATSRYILGPAKQHRVLVCERGPWDTLVDVMADTGLDTLPDKPVGRFYTRQIMPDSTVILVDRERQNILSTRPELQHDHKLGMRIEYYRRLAAKYHWATVDNNGTLEETRRKLARTLGLE